MKEFHETLASKLSLVRFRTFAQGREITRKESEQARTLQEWGFKELEAVMIQVQERAKEVPHIGKVSTAETWVSARFDDLHKLLSAEPRIAYCASNFLATRPPEPKFVEKLRNLETPWEQIFSTIWPWDLFYSLAVLNECVDKFMKNNPEFQWVAAFGEKYHANIVELVDRLSQSQMALSFDWPFCFCSAISILDGLLMKGLSHWFPF